MKTLIYAALAVLLSCPALAGAASVGLQIKPSQGGGLVFKAYNPDFSQAGYLRIGFLLPKGQKLENLDFRLKRGGADWVAQNYITKGWNNRYKLDLPALQAGEWVELSISSQALPLSSISAIGWFITDNAAIDYRYEPLNKFEHAPLDALYMQTIKAKQ